MLQLNEYKIEKDSLVKTVELIKEQIETSAIG